MNIVGYKLLTKNPARCTYLCYNKDPEIEDYDNFRRMIQQNYNFIPYDLIVDRDMNVKIQGKKGMYIWRYRSYHTCYWIKKR